MLRRNKQFLGFALIRQDWPNLADMPFSKSIADGGGYIRCLHCPDMVHGPIPESGVEVRPAAATSG